jgi:enoyl-CoA hydratase/3-hydroxyacyl-CoA dehydrogenase
VLSSLFAQLRKAQSHPDVLCILLAGAGGKFCAGFDFNLFGTPAMHDLPAARQDWLAQMSALLENGAKPTVAAVQGPALGGGCELAMACNARVCDTGTPANTPATSQRSVLYLPPLLSASVLAFSCSVPPDACRRSAWTA